MSADVYHASDCSGSCSGCGYIADDGLWYAGKCPDRFAPFQMEWSESGVAA